MRKGFFQPPFQRDASHHRKADTESGREGIAAREEGWLVTLPPVFSFRKQEANHEVLPGSEMSRPIHNNLFFSSKAWTLKRSHSLVTQFLQPGSKNTNVWPCVGDFHSNQSTFHTNFEFLEERNYVNDFVTTKFITLPQCSNVISNPTVHL